MATFENLIAFSAAFSYIELLCLDGCIDREIY